MSSGHAPTTREASETNERTAMTRGAAWRAASRRATDDQSRAGGRPDGRGRASTRRWPAHVSTAGDRSSRYRAPLPLSLSLFLGERAPRSQPRVGESQRAPSPPSPPILRRRYRARERRLKGGGERPRARRLFSAERRAAARARSSLALPLGDRFSLLSRTRARVARISCRGYRGSRRADRFVDSRTPLLGIASLGGARILHVRRRRRHLARAPPSPYASPPPSPPPPSPPFFPSTPYISPSEREKESDSRPSRSPPPPPPAMITFLSRRVQGIHWSLYLRHGALLVSRSSGPLN